MDVRNTIRSPLLSLALIALAVTAGPAVALGYQTQPPKPAPTVKSERVSLYLRDVEIRDVLSFFHARFGLNYVIDRSVPKSVLVTIEVDEVPWQEALDAILRAQGLAATSDSGSVVEIQPY